MILGRFKNAVSDVTETIRRAFRDPDCHSVLPRFSPPGAVSVGPLEATGVQAAYRFEPERRSPDLTIGCLVRNERMGFDARLCGEGGWAPWAAGAKVCEMPVFRMGNCSRLTVPPLPRSVPGRKVELPPFRASSRWIRDAIARPAVRSLISKFPPPRTFRALDLALGIPIAITGEDFQKLPRALNMRYTFQLVKATGENIRNLDVLGVFPVPVKGVASLSHDPRSGRILLSLNQEAVGARRGRFILARRKDDRSFVSCFVEE